MRDVSTAMQSRTAPSAGVHADQRLRLVVGFVFTTDFTRMLLMRKARPAWQAGLLNGIGGKVESGETDVAAMRRECHEEAGIWIANWSARVVVEHDDGPVVVYFRSVIAVPARRRQTPEGTLESHPAMPVPGDAVPDLHWVVPLCLDDVVGPIQVRATGPGAALQAALAHGVSPH